jgi:hypothetical protein
MPGDHICPHGVVGLTIGLRAGQMSNCKVQMPTEELKPILWILVIWLHPPFGIPLLTVDISD